MDQVMSVAAAAEIAGVTPQAIMLRVDSDPNLGKKSLGRVQINCDYFFKSVNNGTGFLTVKQARHYLDYGLGANAALHFGLPEVLERLVPAGSNPEYPCIHWHEVEKLITAWEQRAFYWSELMRTQHKGRWWFGRRRPYSGRHIGTGKLWA